MARAILKFDEREMTIGEDATSFGRTTDNTVSFPDNTNISRNHAEIEYKDGKYVVTDLGSSNGTTINGQKIEGETDLNNGDFITLGNSIIVEFVVEDDTPENADEAVEPESVNEAKSADDAGKSSRLPVILGVTGAVCGLAVVLAVAAIYVSIPGSKDSKCEATARIVSPINGEIISVETEIKVEVKNSACVSVVRVTLNGKEIANMNTEPYVVQIDPKDYPELANGMLNDFQVVLEDIEGNKIPQPLLTSLQFETKKIVKPPPTATAEVTPTRPVSQSKEVKLSDIQAMVAKVVGKFTGGNFKYNLSNPEFLKEVQKKTANYSTAEGYFQRANGFKDVINQSFVRDRALDPSLPYILAMSRSKFNLEKQGANEGLWQISNDFATTNLYFAVCQTQNLSEPTQECAAKVAALYMENLVVNTFDFDIVYAVAAFGKNQQEANTWKTSLPADRTEFWKIITDANQREEIVRFFAAAIVAENPQKFGLKKDRPISEFYPSVAK